MTADASKLAQVLQQPGGLPISGGGDSEEAQLDALLRATCPSIYNWRKCSMRLVMLTSDAPYHTASNKNDKDSRDTTGWSNHPANNGDCDLGINGNRIEEDYPSETQVGAALQTAGGLSGGIYPVFAVTAASKYNYERLVLDWGFGEVVSLDANVRTRCRTQRMKSLAPAQRLRMVAEWNAKLAPIADSPPSTPFFKRTNPLC